MADVLYNDIFVKMAESYDKCSAMYNKPYPLTFETKGKNPKSWTQTACLPAPNFAMTSIFATMHLTAKGEVLGVVLAKSPSDSSKSKSDKDKDDSNVAVYKPIPRPLVDNQNIKCPGVVFANLRYICKELRTTDKFFEQYDAFVQTGVKVPEFVKIVYDYYRKDTLLQDLEQYLPKDVWEVLKDKKKDKAAKEEADDEVETSEETTDEVDTKSKKSKKVKEDDKPVFDDRPIIYFEVDGFPNIEYDTEYMKFCADFVDFVNRRNKTIVRDVCMIEGKETDCILIGNGKSKDESMKFGYLPKFPYEKSAKIVSKADSRNFTGNLRYNCRCKSAVECMSIGYDIYQKVLAMFSFLIKMYNKSSMLCWAENEPTKAVGMGEMLPEFDFKNEDTVEVDMVSESILNQSIWQSFKDLISMRVNRYPFSNEDKLIIVTPLVGSGRVTFDDFNYLDGSSFRQNIGHWYRYLYDMRSNGRVFFPTIRNLLDAICYTESNASKAKLVSRWRRSFITSMYKGTPISSEIMTTVMANMRRSALGLYKPVTSFKTTQKQYVSTVVAMLRYNLSFKEGDRYMVLDTTITDRSYVMGRRLAFYHFTESIALQSRDNTSTTITNAQKYTTRFIQMPASTDALLYEKLVKGHIHKLSKGLRVKLEKLSGEIYANLEDGDFSNKPLDNKWLLGYTLQLNALYKKKDVSEITELQDISTDNQGNDTDETDDEIDVESVDMAE